MNATTLWRVALLLVVGVFGAAALGKLLDPASFVFQLEDLGVPGSISRLVAFTVIGAEASVCIALLVRPYRGGGVLSAALLLFLFSIGTAVVFLVRGEGPGCGCFGALWKRASGPATVAEDLVLFGVAAWTALRTSREGRFVARAESVLVEVARSFRPG